MGMKVNYALSVSQALETYQGSTYLGRSAASKKWERGRCHHQTLMASLVVIISIDRPEAYTYIELAKPKRGCRDGLAIQVTPA
jgi:hypothetical protein